MRLATGEFAYITITDTKPTRDSLARHYDEFIPVVKRFGEHLRRSCSALPHILILILTNSRTVTRAAAENVSPRR